MDWSLEQVVAESQVPATLCRDLDVLVEAVAGDVRPGDTVVVMSNGGFGDIHGKLLERLGAGTAT